MADKNWRSNPEIMAASAFCKQFHRRATIILSIEGGRFHLSSYGIDGQTCKAAGKVADAIARLISDGTLDVSEV